MSLVCIRCGKTLVSARNPDHYGMCCEDMTEKEQLEVFKSNQRFLVWCIMKGLLEPCEDVE